MARVGDGVPRVRRRSGAEFFSVAGNDRAAARAEWAGHTARFGYLSGLDGSVAGSANYVPELLVKATTVESPLSDALMAQKTITSLAGLSRKYGQWAANYNLVKIIRGYDVGIPREPIFALGKEAEEKLATDARVIYPLMKAK